MFELRLYLRIDFLLELTVLWHSLDHDIGLANAVASEIRDQPIERIADLDRFSGNFLVQARRAFQGRGNWFRLHVGEGNPQTTKRAPCSDIAAHGACTDDMDVPKVTALPRAVLHLFPQKEHAD